MIASHIKLEARVSYFVIGPVPADGMEPLS